MRWLKRGFIAVAILVVLVILGRVGQDMKATSSANKDAVQENVAATTTEVTAVQRCIGANLAAWDKQPTRRPKGATKDEFKAFSTDICREAKKEGKLLDTGEMYQADAVAVAKKVVAKHGPYFP